MMWRQGVSGEILDDRLLGDSDLVDDDEPA